MKSKITIEDNKLIIENFNINEDGTVDVDISEEEWKDVLKAHIPRKNGYEKTNAAHKYYFVNSLNEVVCDVDCSDPDNYARYNAANYYSDEEVAENNARADKLMRQLRRFAVEHRERDIDWDNSEENKYVITFNHALDRLGAEENQALQSFGSIVFNTRELAQLAADTFHDELMWYFIEYKDSL